MSEKFGNHMKPLKEWIRIEIDWENHPLDKIGGWLVGLGSVITRSASGHTTGDSDREVWLDGEDDTSVFHKFRVK